MSDSKRTIYRSIIVCIVIGLVTVYVVQILRAKVVGDRRLQTNDIVLVALGFFVCALVLRPGILGRVSRVELLGMKVEVEALKAKQERQEDELAGIQLVMPLLLPERERGHLRNLESGNCMEYEGGNTVRTELRHLRSMDLIWRKGNHNIAELRDGLTFDLAEYVELTHAGREWLKRLSTMDNTSAADGTT